MGQPHMSPAGARGLVAIGVALALAACGDRATQTVQAGSGPNPVLPPPVDSTFPTINFARAVGWPAGIKPTAAPGLSVAAYASGLDHPRWLHVLPNGDVLVAETNEPRTDAKGAIGGWINHQVMNYIGAGVVSPDRITLLRGITAAGLAEQRSVFLSGLHSPFGMALVGNSFYVANTDAVVRYPYTTGATAISAPGVKVMDLPGAAQDGHWTRDLLADREGTHLYVTVGSASNVAEQGIDREVGRAAIHELNLATGHSRIFASGLRNPNGLAWQPQSGELWVAVNERDDLGSDLVPDYMTSVRDGAFYGWPYSYFGQHVDTRVTPQRADLVARAIAPDYALGPHTASLGLAFYEADGLPGHYVDGAFIGQHGSWNRKPASGYKVIFVPFSGGRPSGPPEDVLTGFLSPDGEAYGRPVGIAVDHDGALLVADDVGNTIWRVTRQASK
jgi:glucose/arabinose dehydrogenase